MEDYSNFLESKKKTFIESGFEVNENELNSNLFDFQRFIVKTALKKGRFAIFADCGLGKTLMQLSWSNAVYNHTGKKVLILAPLAVSAQTKQEANKFGIDMNSFDITNYEQLSKIDCSVYSGVVLDESSILKNYNGSTKQLILDTFKNHKYKLACTATPSPNDHIELGNHAEFLNVTTSKEMVSIFFINDAFNKDHTISKWRLKKHSTKDFWNWVSSWSLMLSNPSDIGFIGDGYVLPELFMNELQIDVEKQSNGKLFNDIKVSATDFYKELKVTQENRVKAVAEILNSSTETFIVWIKSNEEEKELISLVPDAIAVNGSDKPELKEKRLLGFANNEFRILVTKTKIAQFGLNYQHCKNQIFLSFDFSFEGLYQAIRRSWRFGQKNNVNVTLVTVETMGNVIEAIKDKQIKFENMQKEMQRAMNEANAEIHATDENFRTEKGNNWTLVNGDSTQYIKTIQDNSIDYTFFSPPFSDLYMYSSDVRDLSNNSSYSEFFKHFEYMIPELLRITKEGRLLSMHCTQLSKSKGRDGKLSNLIIETFKTTPYKLACTATPSPNDHMELGQHSEFLGGMSYLEMLAMFFVHDGGETSKWRLRKHAQDNFWKYVSGWSMAIDTPASLGFCSDGYDLPDIEYIEHIIKVDNNTQTLFNDVAISATDLHKDLNRSFDARVNKTLELVNSNDNQWIVWGLKNNETDTLSKTSNLIPSLQLLFYFLYLV